MSPEKQKQILEDLHLAALKVAGCIICLPNHFEKVELKEGWNQGLSKLANMGVESPKAAREDKEILAQLVRDKQSKTKQGLIVFLFLFVFFFFKDRGEC